MTGNSITLVEADVSHGYNYWELLNNEVNQRLVGDPINERDMGDTEDWLRKKQTDVNTKLFSIFKGADFCGYVQVVNIHLANLTGVFGINLVPTWQGRGVGREAMLLFNKYCRNQLGLRKLILHVRADNTPAVRLYESLNYRTVGHLRDHIIGEDGLHDELIMELFL